VHWDMPQISHLNTFLMLWLIVSAILAVMLTTNNDVRFEVTGVKDAIMDLVRILFVAVWVGMLLAQATILAKGPEGQWSAIGSGLDATTAEAR
jgi:hypothetical protein